MPEVTVSEKYQVVIPRAVREKLKIRKGQKMMVFTRNGSITIVPLRDIRELKGFLAGMSTEGIRDEEDRY